MKKFLILAFMLSSTVFATTMGDHRKLEKAEEIINYRFSKLKDFKVERAELGFTSYSLKYLLPFGGQLLAYTDYAKEGDQDIDGYDAVLTKDNIDYNLSCVMRSEKKKNIDSKTKKEDGTYYLVSLERCDLENIFTGKTEDIGYLGFTSWVVRKDDPVKTKMKNIFDSAFSEDRNSFDFSQEKDHNTSNQ